MTKKEFAAEQYRISFIAGMNQCYHQRMACRWGRCDRVVRITVGLLAVVSLILAVNPPTGDASTQISIGVAIVGMIAAVVLNITSFGDWQRDHASLFRAWTELREEIDSLANAATSTPVSDDLCHWVTRLGSKVHRIVGAEPAAWKSVLADCERREREARGDDSPVDSLHEKK